MEYIVCRSDANYCSERQILIRQLYKTLHQPSKTLILPHSNMKSFPQGRVGVGRTYKRRQKRRLRPTKADSGVKLYIVTFNDVCLLRNIIG